MGALPPELRARVRKDELSDITYEFRMALEDFLIDKIFEIREASDALHYYLPRISDLVKAQCYLDFGAVNYAGVREWSGLTGFVGKMSFPQIHAEYALKVFDIRKEILKDAEDHGPWYEIPNAFAAMHAEPRDNSRVYMASFIYEPYMLSGWEGDVVDGKVRKNENEIFKTYKYEAESRNYRNGRRIDYGATYRTEYGEASYRVRKMYRKILNAVKIEDNNALCQLAQEAASAPQAAQADFIRAMTLVHSSLQLSLYGM